MPPHEPRIEIAEYLKSLWGLLMSEMGVKDVSFEEMCEHIAERGTRLRTLAGVSIYELDGHVVILGPDETAVEVIDCTQVKAA